MTPYLHEEIYTPNNDELSSFRDEIITTDPSDRSIIVLKPHAFADLSFRKEVISTVSSLGVKSFYRQKLLTNESEVSMLHSVLLLDDPVFGNGWKALVYQESLSGPFLAIGIIGEGVRKWGLDYKRFMRNIHCPDKNGNREIVRNYLHTPDDIGEAFPQEFSYTVNLFF